MEVTLTISREEVFGEVAVVTGYTGAKSVSEDGNNAYDHVSTIDEDHPELRRFYDQCRSELADYFSTTLIAEGFRSDNDTYDFSISEPKSFNLALQPTMQIAMFNYFVYGIIWRWYMYVNKEEAAAYSEKATAYLDSLHSKSIKKTLQRKSNPF